MSTQEPQQDMSALINLISELQKTIAALTARLARYEEKPMELNQNQNQVRNQIQENNKSQSGSLRSAPFGCPKPSTSNYQGRSYDPNKDRFKPE